MKKLLRIVVRTYVIMKVTPVIIKGVGFVVECLAIGVSEKVSDAIFGEEKDVEKKRTRRNLKNAYTPYDGSYTGYRSYYKRKA